MDLSTLSTLIKWVQKTTMITNIAFTIPGQPQGKGRARIAKVGNHARMFTPAKTVAYESLAALAAQQAMAGAKPFNGACAIVVDAVYAIPASASKKRATACLSGLVRPTKKPDGDNILKAVCDGINGIVWKDDVQAVDARVTKRYGETPCVHVTVAELWQEQA